jgi:phosphoribosylformylglycinamidine cyclo-ligase
MIQQWGEIDPAEMARTFNMGIGFCLVAAVDTVTVLIEQLGSAAQVIGRIE